MSTLTVALGERSYPIHIEPGILARAGALLAPHTRGRVLVIADETVAMCHGAVLAASLTAAGIDHRIATFPAGEPSKTLATAERMWAACAEAGIDRGGLVVGFGGGVSGDLAGFVAACWMRGVRFAQIPTTLLAMVDSSVGGKTAVNAPFGKNLVGAFHQPSVVVIDPTLVATMAPREYRAGLAEVVKYGVINDPAFLTWQETNAAALAAGDPDAVAHAVRESCRIKAWYVAEDETEQGVRAHLNYGHTFGHAIERDTRYERWLHGEAVAIGMGMAADLSARLGLLADPDLPRRQAALLAALDLPRRAERADPERLTGHCRLDKKAAAGRCRFVLPRRAGTVDTVVVEDLAAVAASFAAGMDP
jgi:3-dehydroquinate synthase